MNHKNVAFAQHQPQQQQQIHQIPQPQLSVPNQKQPQINNNNAPQLRQSNSEITANTDQVDQSPAEASSSSISYLDKDGNPNVLENPAYNPDIYSSFIPQDAIQQYLNYFGGPVPYTAGVLPPPTPLAVQTGYEGYIIPVQPQQTETSLTFWSFLRGLIPKVLFAWMLKLAAIALSAVGLVLFGGALTTAICALTPLCTISFTAAMPAIGKSLSDDATLNRVKRVAEFLNTAIEKYNELQRNDRSAFIKKIGRRY
ncbi:uncharacterized protein LOC129612008 [Condylostylus longicornis]|uniref:uncharacterized protein LOC129612008 n=1 Tax=Condylostylus longicornis TaxID=2530218 RepID=UPI00244E03B5|nr:uncharacterized protein LOC129612008 [Condylostylus longicornis]